MTTLEDMRADWARRDRAQSAMVERQEGVLREAMAERLREKMRRAGAMTGGGLVLWIALLAGFGAFTGEQSGDWKFGVPGAALFAWTLIVGVATLRERQSLRAVDFGAPPAEVQQRLAQLRPRRARLFQWAFLTGQVVWWIPLAIVAFKGLLGVDLYRVSAFMPMFMAINLIGGLLFIPAALLVSRWLGPRMAGSGLTRGVIDMVAGKDLAEAQALARRMAEFRWGAEG